MPANPDLIKSFSAEGTINPLRIVKFGAADGGVLQGAATSDLLVGVVLSPGVKASGDRLDVVLCGSADVEFGGTVARGAKVTSDASGRAVAAAPAAGVNAQVIGYALVSAVVGDIAPVLIAPSVLQG